MHIPVLLNPILQHLQPQAGQVIVDATFGAGGYTRAFLESGATVFAFDRDPNVAATAEKLQRQFPNTFHFIASPFSHMAEELHAREVMQVDAIVFDLGVSSMQIDQAERGFSFNKDGPLDMRMSQQGKSAADLVNSLPEKELADLLYVYGDEKKSRQIARAIVEDRKETPFTRTLQLAELIKRIVRQPPQERTHAATRSFQALRIAVNEEMQELEKALQAAEQLLKSDGLLAVVTFHSLEDRMVKNAFKSEEQALVICQKNRLPKTR